MPFLAHTDVLLECRWVHLFAELVHAVIRIYVLSLV